jgi:hypothetical protein
MMEWAALIGLGVGVFVGCLNIVIAQWVLVWWKRRKIVQRRREIGRELQDYEDLLARLAQSRGKGSSLPTPKWMPPDTFGWPPENVADAKDAERWALLQWQRHIALNGETDEVS